jgi:hypothetical protein
MAKTKTSKKSGGRKPAKYTFANPTRSMRATMGGEGRAAVAADHLQTVALANPFSDAAIGQKIPDSDSSKSVVLNYKYQAELTSNVSGELAVFIRPGFVSTVRTGATFGASNIATWNGYTSPPDSSAIQAAFDKYRVVSFGVRLYAVNAPTTQSGWVRCITLASDPTGGSFSYAGGFHEAVEVHSAHDCDIHWISKPIGNQYLDYEDMNTQALWDGVLFKGSGLAASTTCFAYEIYLNVECQVNIGSVTNALATPAADHKPHVLSAAGQVHKTRQNFHNGSTSSLSSKLWGMAKTALVDIASSAIPYFGGTVKSLFGPQQRRLGNIGGSILEVD